MPGLRYRRSSRIRSWVVTNSRLGSRMLGTRDQTPSQWAALVMGFGI
jgi:hypothetical protein